MMFWSVGPFWYMVYGIWYVVYGIKMAFTVYSHMFHVHRAQAAYNVVHLFLVLYSLEVFFHYIPYHPICVFSILYFLYFYLL